MLRMVGSEVSAARLIAVADSMREVVAR